MKIIHVFRAAAGGLFRHVRDLAARQAARGHDIGLVCDSQTGGKMAQEALAALEGSMTLGIERLPMPRLPRPADLGALSYVRQHLALAAPDIVHGHGAKGGLYARLSAHACGAKAVYTAHGGSLHYKWKTPHGALFLGVESALLRRTDGLIFVCDFERRAFVEKIGEFTCRHAIIHNGLPEEEFTPIPASPEASDILFIGELRKLKGVDVLLSAIAALRGQGRDVTATIVGDGPGRAAFEKLTGKLGLNEAVRFPGAMPAREAFPLGRVMVVPSRAESFPYVVLEAQAAAKPVIASNVGGIGEMLEPQSLVPPDDAPALAGQIAAVLDDPQADERAKTRLSSLQEQFSVTAMADKVLDFYQTLLKAGST